MDSTKLEVQELELTELNAGNNLFTTPMEDGDMLAITGDVVAADEAIDSPLVIDNTSTTITIPIIQSSSSSSINPFILTELWGHEYVTAQSDDDYYFADAEKHTGTTGGDSLLCWAAAASNILQWGGWAESITGISDEDDVLEHFAYHWTDAGGRTDWGQFWWVTGIMITDTGAAYTDIPSGGGFHTNITNVPVFDAVTGGIVGNYQFHTYWAFIVDHMEAGHGVELSIRPSGANMGHAITAWGYEETDGVKYLYYSDSDDNKTTNGGGSDAPDELKRTSISLNMNVNIGGELVSNGIYQLLDYWAGAGTFLIDVRTLRQYDSDMSGVSEGFSDSRAISLSSDFGTRRGNVDVTGDVDYYSVESASAGYMSVSVDGLTTATTDFSIYDGSDALIASFTGIVTDFEFAVLATTEYHVKVDGTLDTTGDNVTDNTYVVELEYSSSWSDVTAASTPDNLSEVLSSGNNIALDWDDASDVNGTDAGSGVKEYQLQLASDAAFTNITSDTAVTDSEGSFSSISDGTYYWRVRSEDNAGNLSSWATGSSFTVNVVNDDPTGSGLVSDINVIKDVTSDVDLSALTLSDVDSGSSDVVLTLTSGNGTLTALGAGGVIIGGSGTAAITLTGTITELNSYLDTTTNIGYLNLNGNNADTIAVKINDQGYTGTGGGGDVALGTVNVDINSIPTLTSFASVISSVDEDTQVELTLTELKAQGDEADTDGTVDAFVIKDVSSGSLLIGTSSGTATAWIAGTNDTIDATNNAYWTADYNANGTLNAFTAVAKDNDGAESTTAIQAQITVNDVIDNPSCDFDADMESDILFHNQSTGSVGAWMGGDSSDWLTLGYTSPTDWEIVGNGDFNGNGTSDVLWQHKIAGTVGIWESGLSTNWNEGAAVSRTDWEVAGTGDFNGNGTSDVLWQSKIDGTVGIWESGVSANWEGRGAVSRTYWELTGTGDFNGNGTSDILWQHKINGTVAVSEGGLSANWEEGAAVSRTDWEIAGIGDFNGNYTSDVIWQHKVSGIVGIWESGVSTNWEEKAAVSRTDWEIAGTGDFNGNGNYDILWHSKVNDNIGMWESGTNWQSLGDIGDAWDVCIA